MEYYNYHKQLLGKDFIERRTGRVVSKCALFHKFSEESPDDIVRLVNDQHSDYCAFNKKDYRDGKFVGKFEDYIF